MKCLVTGGLGFIGSNLVDELVKQGHTVSVVDDLSTGVAAYENKQAKYYIAQITDYKKMLEITKDIDCIFHEAAWARVQRSVDDPMGTNHVNVTGTLTMLEVARLNRVRRFIFASSSSVYGLQEKAQMNERMTPNPLHPYALQKYTNELYCRLYSKLYGLNTVCLRYFNVYGPRQVLKGDYALVIGKFLKQRQFSQKFTVYGDGTQTRAYTHVLDVVRANIMASEMTFIHGDHWVFNVGTDKETSINDLVTLMKGEALYINPNPRGQFDESRKCADYSLIRSVLGWEPTVTIEDGIKDLL